MTKYKVKVEGVIKYAKLIETTDEEGETVMVNDTAGISTERYFTADSHSEAKQLFKNWVSEKVANRDAVGFEGTVSAWTVEETLLLDKSPFNVEVEITENIIVDF